MNKFLIIDDLSDAQRKNLENVKVHSSEQTTYCKNILEETNDTYDIIDLKSKVEILIDKLANPKKFFFLEEEDLKEISIVTLNFNMHFPVYECMVGQSSEEDLDEIFNSLTILDKQTCIRLLLENKIKLVREILNTFRNMEPSELERLRNECIKVKGPIVSPIDIIKEEKPNTTKSWDDFI